MGKKFITLQRQSIKYRLFAADIKNVFQKQNKKLPIVPKYVESSIIYDDET